MQHALSHLVERRQRTRRIPNVYRRRHAPFAHHPVSCTAMSPCWNGSTSWAGDLVLVHEMQLVSVGSVGGREGAGGSAWGNRSSKFKSQYRVAKGRRRRVCAASPGDTSGTAGARVVAARYGERVQRPGIACAAGRSVVARPAAEGARVLPTSRPAGDFVVPGEPGHHRT